MPYIAPAYRRKLPGVDLFAPSGLEDLPEFGAELPDTGPGMRTDFQAQVEAAPPPPPAPAPPVINRTGPAAAVANIPPPVPDARASWKGAAVPPPPVPRPNPLAPPEIPPAPLDLGAPSPGAPAPRPADSWGMQEYKKLGPPPEPTGKPRWYQRLLAGAAAAAARNPEQGRETAEDILHPGYRKQAGAYQRKKQYLEDVIGQERSEEAQDALREEREARAAYYGRRTPTLADQFTELRRSNFSEEEAKIVLSGGHLPAKESNEMVEIAADVGKKYGLVPDAQGKYFAPKQAIGTLIRTADKKDDDSVTEAQLALRAATGDQTASRALDLIARQKRAERPPKETTEAERSRQRQETVRKLAQQAMNDSRAGGGSTYDDAVRNVQRFYPDDFDMNEHRDEVIAQLNRWKLAGIRPEQVQAALDKAKGTGRISAQLRIPGAPATAAAAAPVKKAAAPQAQTASAAPPAPPPAEVTAKLEPGEHTFRNGQTWRKNADGTVEFVR
jgi:hypothetical protein